MSGYLDASTYPDATNGANSSIRATEKALQVAVENADYRTVDRTKLTPMMQHFVEVKEQYPHAMLLYRVGDFYETFFQDARRLAEELELVLTSKESGKGVARTPKDRCSQPMPSSDRTLNRSNNRCLASPGKKGVCGRNV